MLIKSNPQPYLPCPHLVRVSSSLYSSCLASAFRMSCSTAASSADSCAARSCSAASPSGISCSQSRLVVSSCASLQGAKMSEDKALVR